MILKFIWYVLNRFAKSFGFIFFIAGLGVAAYFYQQKMPMIDAVRYRQSNLLQERLGRLDSVYGDSQRLVMKFKGADDFPTEFAAASFKPHFPQSYSTVKDFQDLQGQLAGVSSGKDAMKRFVTAHFEILLNAIQQKLMAHASSLAQPPSVPKNSVTPKPVFTPDYGLYDNSINSSEVESRKSRLDNAKQFLGVLQSSAENDENKKTLGDSIAEIDALAKLFPSQIDQVPVAPAPPVNYEPREPLNAEKVAARIAGVRNSVRQAVLSSWALDEADDRALQTAEDEQGKFMASQFRVKQLTQELNLAMAAAITAGFVLGMFFLLIGDWTQKSLTELLAEPWRHLIENFSASPSEVYQNVEKCVDARKIPGIETTREFWHEGGAISAKREYLRFARERLVFEICAAPFGTGFFLSFRAAVIPKTIDPLAIFLLLAVCGGTLIALVNSFGLLWGAIILLLTLCVVIFLMRTAVAHGLANVDRVLMKTPVLGTLYELFLRRDTYYRLDTTEMYVRAVENAVSEAFQGMFGEHGVNLLSETVSKPLMDEIYRKHFP